MKIGDKFVKDGEVVEVTDIGFANFENENGRKVTVSGLVMFKKRSGNGISFISDFLEQYKSYEVVYEFQYAFSNIAQPDSIWVDSTYFRDVLEIGRNYSLHIIRYQRLDFTKRERVQ